MPSVPLDSELTQKSNSYLVDFFKHGDKTALERENGIRAADVWFDLKDFSLVLASIVASLEGFLRPDGGDLDHDGAEDSGYDDEDSGEAAKDWGGREEKEKVMADDGGGGEEPKEGKHEEKKKKKLVADSWEDEETSESDSKSETGRRSGIKCQESYEDEDEDEDWDEDEDESEDEDIAGSGQGQDQSLVKVYEALKRVKTEFNEKFLKIWS